MISVSGRSRLSPGVASRCRGPAPDQSVWRAAPHPREPAVRPLAPALPARRTRLLCPLSPTRAGARLPWESAHPVGPRCSLGPSVTVASLTLGVAGPLCVLLLWDPRLKASPGPPWLGPMNLSGVLLRSCPLSTWWQLCVSPNAEQNQTLPLSGKPAQRIPLGQDIENRYSLHNPFFL